MPKYLEWDFDNPKHRRRRRRPPPPMDGEILEPEPSPRIRVKVTVHRQRHQIPPWIIALVIFAALAWVSPLGLVIALVMAAVLVTAHPTIAIAFGILLVLIIGIAIRERLAGRPF